MGRCTSSGSRSGGGVGVTSVTDAYGATIDLSDNPLVYGNNDTALSQAARSSVEAFEDKRRNAKVEWAKIVDENGNPQIVGYNGETEKRGGKGSVGTRGSAWVENGVMTHIHPRDQGSGYLGGTFSKEDLASWSSTKVKTIRAAAAEGTYSISKKSGFDKTGFMEFRRSIEASRKQEMRKTNAAIASDYKSGKISWESYNQKYANSFNAFLVGVHNDLLAGQNKYGYTYTLERRK